MAKYPLLRDPFESELEYFKMNPHVAGMATEDDRVIFNPYSKVIPKQSDSVYKNESARIQMRKSSERPDFQLTQEQSEAFKNYGDIQDQRETIAARSYAGDESSGELTDEQRKYIQRLVQMMQHNDESM